MSRTLTSLVRSDVAHSSGGPLDRRRFLRGVGGSAVAAAALAAGRPAFASLSATPEAAPGSVLDELAGLLALVPGSVANEAVSQGVLFYHADLKAQFDALGVDRSVPGWALDVPIALMTSPLALASPLFQYSMLEELFEALGFEPLNVDRALETGVPPAGLSLLQGAFDRDRMESAWEQAGYEAVSLADDMTMWTKGEEGELDLNDPLGSVGAGALNNLLMLDDDTLVMSRMGAVVRDVVRQAAQGRDSEGSSMLGMPQVETALRSLLPTTTSSVMVSGAMLVPRFVPDFSATGTPEAAMTGGQGEGAVMPAAAMAAFGVEAGTISASAPDDDEGSTPPALPGETPIEEVKRAQVRLAMASKVDAETAVEIVPERWETLRSILSKEPYSDLMVLLDADVSTEEPTVAAFDFDQGAAGKRWLKMVITQDLLPFAPGSL